LLLCLLIKNTSVLPISIHRCGPRAALGILRRDAPSSQTGAGQELLGTAEAVQHERLQMPAAVGAPRWQTPAAAAVAAASAAGPPELAASALQQANASAIQPASRPS